MATCGWCEKTVPDDATKCPHCQGDIASGDMHRKTVLAATRPAVPAGWYNDPKMVNTRRYWDGNAWTDHRQEATPVTAAPVAAAAPAGAGGKDDPSFVWALAVLPFIGVAQDWTVPKFSHTDIASVAIILAATVLCVLDSNRLKARGIEPPMIFWVFLVPVYLILRTRRAGSIALIPIVWFIAFTAAIVSVFTSPTPTTFKGDDIAQVIQVQLESTFGTDANVSCPDAKNVLKGDSIDCQVIGTTVADITETAHVEFDNHGGFSWRIVP